MPSRDEDGGEMAQRAGQVEGDVVYLKDNDRLLPLNRTRLGGVEVYTVTDPEKVAELRQRLRDRVAPPDPSLTFWQRLRAIF